MRCELCNQEAKVEGETTKYYVGLERQQAFKECIEIVFKTSFKGEVSFANFQDNIIKALKAKMEER